MRRTLFLILSVLVFASLIAACGGAAPAPAAPAAPAAEEAAAPAAEAPAADASAATTETAAVEEAAAVTETAATTETAAAEPAPAAATTPSMTPAPEPTPMEGRVQVRWFCCLGSGDDPQQQELQQKVADEFNASQDKIQLIREVIDYDVARDALATQIASGNPPDIVGPVGWGGSNGFYGHWMDLAPLIEKSGYDTTQFSDELVKYFQTEEGQVGLPFAVYPAGVFFQKAMFDEAGLNYPPTAYGDKYVWPDGTEEDWSFDTLTKVAKILTVDANGNSPLMLDDSGKVVEGKDFDPNSIVQYGYIPQYQDPFHVGAFFGAGTEVQPDGTAKIPEQWKEAWKWEHDGIFGKEPFIPTTAVASSAEFGAGNPFNGGKMAMAITHMWYTCCVGDAGDSWDLAVLPSYKGTVHGRVDADTFRILKESKHPDEAFTVLSYLIGEGAPDLLEAYGGMPSRESDMAPFFKAKSEQFPWVKNWDSIKAGLAYPDIPSAEGYRPGFLEVFDRYRVFRDLYRSDPNIDMDAEIAKLESDFTEIFARNK